MLGSFLWTVSITILFFLGSGYCGGHAEQDIDASSDGTLPALNEFALVEPATHGRAKQGIEAISTGGHQREKYAQEEDLSDDGSASRVDKLWQKGIEEKRRFGVE